MRPLAIQIIKDEHSAIAAVLYTLRHQARQMRRGEAPNLPLLFALLDYIVAYPDRWHHPKEDQYLFAAVKRRTHEADALIAALEREHQQGIPMIEDLKRLLLAIKEGAPTADFCTDFCDHAERYVEYEWAHMRKEEDELMPLAERVLPSEDWRDINTAFEQNDNPLFGLKPKEDAERLYQKILALAPAPIGYGGAA